MKYSFEFIRNINSKETIYCLSDKYMGYLFGEPIPENLKEKEMVGLYSLKYDSKNRILNALKAEAYCIENGYRKKSNNLFFVILRKKTFKNIGIKLAWLLRTLSDALFFNIFDVSNPLSQLEIPETKGNFISKQYCVDMKGEGNGNGKENSNEITF